MVRLFCESNEKRRLARGAFTLIELLGVAFIVASATVAFMAIRAHHAMGLAVMASMLSVLVNVLLILGFYRWDSRQVKRRLSQLRETYPYIYQVKELPLDAKTIVKPVGAEIQIGDYGWEACSNRQDGLIHLQGLTGQWHVVWHAGFRPEQIEKVAVKSASQYDYWAPYWAKPPPPPPCLYPVRERHTPTMGLPHYSGRYFEQYPAQSSKA